MKHAPKDLVTMLRDKNPDLTPQAVKVMLRGWEQIKIELLRKVGACKTINEILQTIQELK